LTAIRHSLMKKHMNPPALHITNISINENWWWWCIRAEVRRW